MLDWFQQAWAMWVAQAGIWTGITLVFLIIILALPFIPLLGFLIAPLLAPVLLAGMQYANQKASREETLQIDDLFVGFKQKTGDLLLLGLLCMLTSLLITLLTKAFGVSSLLAGVWLLVSGVPGGGAMLLSGLLLTLLIPLLLSSLLSAAMWFAPSLVLFNNMSPLAALGASFKACLKNIFPFLFYGLIVLALFFIAALPAGLGFLILIPVLSGSIYAAYRDIFIAD